jgi:hypothetical protein
VPFEKSCIWKAVCKSAILQAMYLGRKLSPETTVLALFTPANRARKRIPAQKLSPRMLTKTTTSQFVSQGPRPHCLVFLDPPRKTTLVSSGIHIANAPARLQYGSSASKEAPGSVLVGRRRPYPTGYRSQRRVFHLRVLYIIQEGGPGVRVWTSEQDKAEADK